MRRELGFWLMVYGTMGLFIGLALLTLLLGEWGLPSSVALGVGIAAMLGYVFSIWRAFLK